VVTGQLKDGYPENRRFATIRCLYYIFFPDPSPKKKEGQGKIFDGD